MSASRILTAAIAALAIAAAPAAASGGIVFTDWTGQGGGVVSGTLHGTAVSLTGPTGTNVFDGSFLGFNADYFTPRLANSDAVELQGLNGHSYTLAFGVPIANPIIHLNSLASTLQFPQGTVVAKVSGQSTLVVSGASASGSYAATDLQGYSDSNGTIKIDGTVSSLSFTATPTFSGGNVNDGILMQVGVATSGPQTQITIDEPQPLPSGAYPSFAKVTVRGIDESASGSVETRCVLDAPSPPASFDAMAPGCIASDGVTIGDAGTHVVYAASRDALGGVEDPVSRSFRIAGAPDTTITAGPEGTSFDLAPQLAFTSTIAGSTFECRLDGAAYAACGSPFRSPTLRTGRHTFEVRAISPDGVTDPVPAGRLFTIAAPVSKQLHCEVQPVYFRAFTFDFSHPDRIACELRSAEVGTNGCVPKYPCSGWTTSPCPAGNLCTYPNQLCPTGARCTLSARVSWYDADRSVNWGAVVNVALGPQCPFGSGGASGAGSTTCTWAPHPKAATQCTTGFGGDRCFASASIVALGDGSPLWAGCTMQLVFGGAIAGVSQFGSDYIRRVECDADLKIEPVTPLTATASGGSVEVYAPAAGEMAAKLQALSQRLHPRAAAAPKTAPVHVAVPGPGPVAIPVRLNRAAKRLLNRHRKLPIRVTTTFTQDGAPPLTKTTRLTLRKPRPLPRRCIPKKATKKRRACRR